MNCQFCSNPVPADADNCPSCGAPLAAKKEANNNAQSQVEKIEPEKVTPFTAFKKYAQFSGRARRSEYWLFSLLWFVIWLPLFVIDPILAGIWNLATLVPSLAVFWRRMHDIGYSGLSFLWILLPFAGPIILIMRCCHDSQPGTNQYGANPKGM